MSADGEFEKLERSLRRRFRVVATPMDVGSRTISILHPESAEALIDERDFERDERLPYWAELWPSARVLSDQILQKVGAHRTLLELGCGAGLVSTAAALAGYEVCATDYYEDALRFTRLNAWRIAEARIATKIADWRHPPTDLGVFDVIVASDVLYERAYGSLVAQAITALLDRSGVAFIADPGRIAANEFLSALDASGMRVLSRPQFPFVEGLVRQKITVYEVAHAR